MIVKFDKFSPLKSGGISILLTAEEKDLDMLIPLMKSRLAELRPVGADMMPESRIILQNMAASLEAMQETIKGALCEVV